MHILTRFFEFICVKQLYIAEKGHKNIALDVLTALSEINAHECIPQKAYEECYKILKEYDKKIESVSHIVKLPATKKSAIKKTSAKKTSAKKRAPTRRKK